MEDLSGKLQETVKCELPKQKEIKERWSVLFIGDHGKTFAIKHFKLILVSALFFLISTILTSCLFIFLYKDKAEKYKVIKKKIITTNMAFSSLKKENELLLARAVAAEFQLEKNKQDDSDEDSDGLQNKKIVSVRDFNIERDIDSNNMKITFKIKNIYPDLVSIRGYIFVTLKRDAGKESTWLTIPYAELTSGTPSPYTKGRLFVIEFWKEMSLVSGIREPLENFEEATIFVFEGKGNLILKKDFKLKDII